LDANSGTDLHANLHRARRSLVVMNRIWIIPVQAVRRVHDRAIHVRPFLGLYDVAIFTASGFVARREMASLEIHKNLVRISLMPIVTCDVCRRLLSATIDIELSVGFR
jgi:hypothetical protein